MSPSTGDPMRESELAAMSRKLVDVAMGRSPADLVIRHGKWLCVQSGEVVDSTDLAIVDGRFAYVGPDAGASIGPATEVVDAGGRYLVPGLLDGHLHIESSMVTVTEFVRAVLPHGTTGLFIDPHEMANVLGLRGVRLMVDEAAAQPILVWVEMPSCVPSAPGLETPGAEIGAAEVAEAMTWPGVIGLGEVMNFPGVYLGDEKMHAEMAATRRAGGVIGGHYASPDLGLPFHGYAAGGPEDDHEGTRKEDAIARVRQGMKAMLRFGSAWHDVAEQIRAVIEDGLDPRHFLLVTDDSHSATLVREGHMDRVVRHAIQHGLSPMIALQMATINTAEHFGVARDVGQIAPGRSADVLLVKDLTNFTADQVYARGRLAAQAGVLQLEWKAPKYPTEIRSSVRLKRPVTASDFRLPAEGAGPRRAHVIGVVENQAPTRHLQMDVTPVEGEIRTDRGRDLAKLALVERHRASGRIQIALVQGFGFAGDCAVASTIAHDSHHMLVAGTDEGSMAVAANELARVGGGQVVVLEGKVIGLVELPIAGLMSDEPAEVVAEKAEQVLEGFRRCGCELNNPNMQLSLLALVVIPELRVSDLGLVDVSQFKIIPVLEGAEGP